MSAAEADWLTQARLSVDRQFEFLVDELVRQAAGSPDGTVRLKPFLTATRFAGPAPHPGTPRRAARYLRDHGLARRVPSDGESEGLRLTSLGEDCADSHQSVRQYVNTRQSAAAPVFIQNVYGGAATQGVSVTQNVGHPGPDTSLLIERLRGLLGEHGLSGAAVDGDMAVLTDPAQEPASRAGAWHRIKAGLLRAAPALAGQAVLVGIDQGLGPLFGGQ